MMTATRVTRTGTVLAKGRATDSTFQTWSVQEVYGQIEYWHKQVGDWMTIPQGWIPDIVWNAEAADGTTILDTEETSLLQRTIDALEHARTLQNELLKATNEQGDIEAVEDVIDNTRASLDILTKWYGKEPGEE